MTNAPVLEASGLGKSFGNLRALAGVDFTLHPREVHAILGENGAGKSTFMNLLYGLLRRDSGTLKLWGQPYHPASPRDAVQAGVGMVHQHFMLIPALTVAENLALGTEPGTPWRLDLRQTVCRIQELSETYRLPVDPHARVADLPVGIRQRVEILRALSRHARLLILDEPTALLTPQESADLFEGLRQFITAGLSVILISHKLDEVLRTANRITVLRQGKSIGTLNAQDTTAEELAQRMVGRTLVSVPDRHEPAGQPRLVLQNFRVRGNPPLSLTANAAEILGIAGVEGNGQEELVQAIGGAELAAGTITLDGISLAGQSIRERQESGLGWVPSDRQGEGLVLPMDVSENCTLRNFRKAPFATRGWLNLAKWREWASTLITRFDVRPPDPGRPVRNLSGGNQQKVVLAREISGRPKALLICQPTRGLDIGAAEFVHAQLRELRDQGCAVLLVSSDLDEILRLADRVAVLYRGAVVETLSRTQLSRERIGLLMMGGTHKAVVA